MDDHPLYREGLATALEQAWRAWTSSPPAGDGRPGGRTGTGAGPDVVLMDLQMPGSRHRGDPADHAELPGPAVLVLTMIEGDDALFARCGPAPGDTC